MKSEFHIACGGESFAEAAVDSRLLYDKGMFKTLSLLHAKRAGLNVPSTALLFEQNDAFVREIVSRWSLPVMVRMDYDLLPTSKPLGGIPIHSFKAIESISGFLFRHQLCPLLHPNIDRFRDIYSAGIVLTKRSTEIQIELVGIGFDASDLRLGKAIPHESFAYDITNDCFSNRHQISVGDYMSERAERAKRIAQLRCYIDFANQEGQLLPSLEEFNPSADEIASASAEIPNRYSPIGRRDIRTLAGFAWTIQERVLPTLPDSESFVASLSLVPRFNWILWDVYGHWYRR
jgi:hypothetical protein